VGGNFNWGHWEEYDIAVPFISLTNGDEATALLLSPAGSAWPSGDYKLHAVLDRDRWLTTGVPDPEQHYHDEATIALNW
jgi:hypothetical protein